MDLKKITKTKINFKDSIKRRTPRKIEILEIIKKNYERKDYQFEIEVFNFLFQNSEEFGIKSIFQLKDALIDGFLILTDGSSIGLEIKFALNWNKSNVARSQILNFNFEKLFDNLDLPRPKIGIIVFDHFSGDWERIQGNRAIENGWLRFYQEQKSYDSLTPIQILQFKHEKLYNPGLN